MKQESKRPAKSEADSLDNAIRGLVKTLKRDIQKKYGRVDYMQLRKSGYSNHLLARLRQT
jgi:hypothetical protein